MAPVAAATLGRVGLPTVCRLPRQGRAADAGRFVAGDGRAVGQPVFGSAVDGGRGLGLPDTAAAANDGGRRHYVGLSLSQCLGAAL